MLLAVAVMGLPVATDPTGRGLGLPTGEGTSHLWGLVTTARGLWRHGPYLRVTDGAGVPDGVRLDLVDPAHLLLVAPGTWLGGVAGATLAWNLLPLLHLALAAWGADRLAGRLGADGAGRLLAVAGTVATPYLWAGLPLGRSELLGLLLVPLLLSLVADLVTAVRPAKAAVALTAGLLLLVHHGWQALLLSTLALVPGTLLLCRDRRLLRVTAAVAPAVLLALPMLWVQLDTAPWWAERVGGLATLGAEPPRTDLLAAARLTGLRPAPDAFAPAYPGVVALLGALLALADRRARPWALLGLALSACALGVAAQVGGTTLPLPARLLAVVPVLGGLTDWSRLTLVAGPLLAVAAGVGLATRPRPLLLALGALMLVDGASFRAQGPGAFDTRLPDDVAATFAALPDGAVLELPLSGPETRDDQLRSDRALLWALQHGHPVAAAPSPQAPAARTFSVLSRLHEGGMQRPSGGGGGAGGGGEDDCLSTEAGRLHARGFRSVVLWREEDAAGRRQERFVTEALGAPAGSSADRAWWTLSPGDQGSSRCLMPAGAGPPPARPPGTPPPGGRKGPRPAPPPG
ncbi:MAG: hypothetical protein H6742_08980 [Alphaproteobacteria bacterium]|nr:hypothetical protein [Alphaproteobacteria bacterium]